MDVIALSLRSLLLLRRSRRSIRQEELLDARSIIILVALMEAQLMPGINFSPLTHCGSHHWDYGKAHRVSRA